MSGLPGIAGFFAKGPDSTPAARTSQRGAAVGRLTDWLAGGTLFAQNATSPRKSPGLSASEPNPAGRRPEAGDTAGFPTQIAPAAGLKLQVVPPASSLAGGQSFGSGAAGTLAGSLTGPQVAGLRANDSTAGGAAVAPSKPGGPAAAVAVPRQEPGTPAFLKQAGIAALPARPDGQAAPPTPASAEARLAAARPLSRSTGGQAFLPVQGQSFDPGLVTQAEDNELVQGKQPLQAVSTAAEQVHPRIRRWLHGEWQRFTHHQGGESGGSKAPPGYQAGQSARQGLQLGLRPYMLIEGSGRYARQGAKSLQQHRDKDLLALSSMTQDSPARTGLSPLGPARIAATADALSMEWMRALEKVQGRVELLRATGGGEQLLELETPETGLLRISLTAGEEGWKLRIGVERETLQMELQRRAQELQQVLEEAGMLLSELRIDTDEEGGKQPWQRPADEEQAIDATQDGEAFADELRQHLLQEGGHR